MTTSTLTAAGTKWSATQKGTKLTVLGEVTTPTPGYTVTLKKASPQGINPNILVLEKLVASPQGIVPQHVDHASVSFSERTKHHYRQVTIVPDEITIRIHSAG